MLRKISFAVVTAVALGTAALAPTSASAHGFGGGWHGGAYGFRSFSYDRSYDSYGYGNSYESDWHYSRFHRG
jgi:hypothetical protein